MHNFKHTCSWARSKIKFKIIDNCQLFSKIVKSVYHRQRLRTLDLHSYSIVFKRVLTYRIEILDSNDDVMFTSQLHEKILRSDQNHSNVLPPFNAYSASGSPSVSIIYFNWIFKFIPKFYIYIKPLRTLYSYNYVKTR